MRLPTTRGGWARLWPVRSPFPGLFRPVIFGNEVLIDGGAVNPLPYDLLFGLADIILAVDVTLGGRSSKRRAPSPFGSMFGAAQIMQGAITASKNQTARPRYSRAA